MEPQTLTFGSRSVTIGYGENSLPVITDYTDNDPKASGSYPNITLSLHSGTLTWLAHEPEPTISLVEPPSNPYTGVTKP